MKLISFNINGVRAHIHQLETLIKSYQPDIIGLQEIKVTDSLFPFDTISSLGYSTLCYGQKGHYGVALVTKLKPITVEYGFPEDQVDTQRRMIMAVFPLKAGRLTIFNGYFPQGESRGHDKFIAKERFYSRLRNYLDNHLKKSELVVVMGDMNISHSDLDIGIGDKNHQRWLRSGKSSFLPEEREWMDSLLAWGLVDVWRSRNPRERDSFSWFDYRSNGFINNRGLRIDMVLATEILVKRCTGTGIYYPIRSMARPSDHAPVWASFDV